MHLSLYVLVPVKKANTSAAARFAAAAWLSRRARRNSMCDFFVIGGQWSGTLSTAHLSKIKIQAFEKEFEAHKEYNKLPIDQRNARTEHLFRKYFPGFPHEAPYARDMFRSCGYDDDAMIVDQLLYIKIIAGRPVKNTRNFCFDGGEVVATDDLAKRAATLDSVVGEYWIVVLDIHV